MSVSSERLHLECVEIVENECLSEFFEWMCTQIPLPRVAHPNCFDPISAAWMMGEWTGICIESVASLLSSS